MYSFTSPTRPLSYDQPQPHHHFTPKTPSPLRTSRNANLMPPPLPPQWSSSPPLDIQSSPLAPCTSAHQTPSYFYPAPPPRRASTPSLFAATSTCQSTYATRSRSSTPQATLSAQNAAAKNRRKALFRDKIRKQRDDQRFEGRGEQVLRMDFVRERREWEERLKRRAPYPEMDESMEKGDGVGGMEVDDVDSSAVGMEPLAEEEEIEALVQCFMDAEDEVVRVREEREVEGSGEEEAQWQQLGGGSESMVEVYGSYGSDEEDYDQLFMEVISGSQEVEGLRQQSAHQQPWDGGSGLDRCEDHHGSSMDLS